MSDVEDLGIEKVVEMALEQRLGRVRRGVFILRHRFHRSRFRPGHRLARTRRILAKRGFKTRRFSRRGRFVWHGSRRSLPSVRRFRHHRFDGVTHLRPTPWAPWSRHGKWANIDTSSIKSLSRFNEMIKPFAFNSRRLRYYCTIRK